MADVAIMPANSNTATAGAGAATMPFEAPAEPRDRKVEVEARERSVTYRMSPDVLPASVMAALADGAQMAMAEPPTQALAEPVAPTLALPSNVVDGADEADEGHARAFFENGEGQAFEREPAETLGGDEAKTAPAWNDGHGEHDGDLDVANITRRFGLNRQRA
jgi:hypothetical protein